MLRNSPDPFFLSFFLSDLEKHLQLPLAQLDRALVYETRGREFESSKAGQIQLTSSSFNLKSAHFFMYNCLKSWYNILIKMKIGKKI